MEDYPTELADDETTTPYDDVVHLAEKLRNLLETLPESERISVLKLTFGDFFTFNFTSTSENG